MPGPTTPHQPLPRNLQNHGERKRASSHEFPSPAAVPQEHVLLENDEDIAPELGSRGRKRDRTEDEDILAPQAETQPLSDDAIDPGRIIKRQRLTSVDDQGLPVSPYGSQQLGLAREARLRQRDHVVAT